AAFCGVLQFFFSSRRRHTRSKRDWSSDVCSSDLATPELTAGPTMARTLGLLQKALAPAQGGPDAVAYAAYAEALQAAYRERLKRSEERRVGKEWRAGSVRVQCESEKTIDM